MLGLSCATASRRPAPAAVLSVVALLVAAAPAGAATFTPVGDSYTRADQASKNFGGARDLRVDSYPVADSFVRFDVRGVGRNVTRATLRLYAASSVTSSGLEVRGVASSAWGETTITHANRPALGSFSAKAPGPISAGQWVTVDVTPLVAGDGLVSVALTTASSTERHVASRETGSTAPQLVVEAGSGAPPPPAGDTTPPDTSITSGPSGSTSSTSASLAFTSTESGSTFACRLDSGSWGACTSPRSYSGMASGSHTFAVRATDTAGNTDGSPATRTWTVGSAPPPPPPPPPGPGGAQLPAPLVESSGAVFHVATTGSDAGAGTAAAPWATVQKALNSLQAGQRALVHAGTYVQALDLTRACAAAAPCTVEGAPGEPRPVLRVTNDHVLRAETSAAYWRLRGFTFRDSNITSGGLVDLYGHHLEVSHSELTASGDQDFYLDEASHHIQLLSNWMHHSGLGRTHQSHGAYLQGNDHLVANNVIHDHPFGFGIQVYDKGLRSIVVNNTITHNAHSGIVVGGGGGVSGVIVRNNILAFNSHNGLAWDGTCPNSSAGTTYADRNVIFGNGYGPIDPQSCSATDTSAGNRLTDPLFVDAGARNLHLQSGSPAFGYALPDWAPATDRDGVNRPRGSGADTGAYEDE